MYRAGPSHNTISASSDRWRTQHSVLTLRRNGNEHNLVLTPLASVAFGSVIALLVCSLIVSSAYLFLRDDIVSASLSQQAQMKNEYENRITALRSKIDFAKSRQYANQAAIEKRVSQLLVRQKELGSRTQQINRALGNKKPKIKAQVRQTADVKMALGLRLGSRLDNVDQTTTASIAYNTPTAALNTINKLEISLTETEEAQRLELVQLKKSADHKTKMLASILSKQGIKLPKSTGTGGPLIELKVGDDFLNSVNALDSSLKTLAKVRLAAKHLPHGSPAPGQKISSSYGSRKDPFTGRRAVHGGLDFKARRGARVLATASGKIIKAGRSGGYGKLVEIDHGGGITTRYAHLSKIRVKVGQRVSRGTRIGNVGSTGRSTGPHLHYEVRRKGRSLNPIHYVRLEKHLRPYL